MRASRKSVGAFLRHHYEQDLFERLLTGSDIFIPEPLDTWTPES
ncbi:hypothetical protein [Streptomyces sp. NPDC093260]